MFSFIYPLLILYRQMPALTRRGKRELPRDAEEDEDGACPDPRPAGSKS